MVVFWCWVFWAPRTAWMRWGSPARPRRPAEVETWTWAWRCRTSTRWTSAGRCAPRSCTAGSGGCAPARGWRRAGECAERATRSSSGWTPPDSCADPRMTWAPPAKSMPNGNVAKAASADVTIGRLRLWVAIGPVSSLNKEYLSQIQLYSIFGELPVLSNTVLIITAWKLQILHF